METANQESSNPRTGDESGNGAAAATERPIAERRATASIEARLDDREGHLAARALVAAVARGDFAEESSLSEWLQNLEPQRKAKLISAFAHYPCFACRNGLESCDACGGSGFSAAAQVCVACVGLGEKRCDFCAGSGLATYNVIPTELWPHVVIARATRAVKYLQKVAVQSPTTHASLSEAATTSRIHDLNKLLGVLENAVAALRQLKSMGAVAPEFAGQVIKFCKRPTAMGVMAMRESLRRLATHHENLAATLPPVDTANAEAKAEFYEDLSASDTLSGTGLSHVSLHESLTAAAATD